MTIHPHQIVVAVLTVGSSLLAGCNTSQLRTGSNEGSDGAAAPDVVSSGTGGTAGQIGAGSGGIGTSPAGAGGAERRDGAMGTGGMIATGGVIGGAGGGAEPIDSGAVGVALSSATVQLASTRQEMAGFGINISWAQAMSDEEADALFDPTNGLGLSILRMGMSSSGGYVSNNIPQDVSKAKARGVKHIIGTLASPPATCKDNRSENGGGHLLASCYDSWSDTIARFAQNNGLYGISLQNEPDYASCGDAEPCNGDYPTTLYTAEELVAFIKVLAPKLHAAGIKVIAPEASEWLHTWSNESACCSEPSQKRSTDPLGCGSPATHCAPGEGYDYGHSLYADEEAWSALDIMGVHQYGTHEAAPWPADVPDRKPIWQTEAGGVRWWPEQGPSSDISNGVAVAGWIHDALAIGDAAAWLWFWYRSNGTSDNLGLLVGNTDTKRHYTLGNYSRFIRPGYTRVDITADVPADVLLSAFKGPDGTLVVVAINKGSTLAMVQISVSGGAAPAALTPWVTSESDNLVAKTAVTASGGSFTAMLASMTVTTFVGK